MPNSTTATEVVGFKVVKVESTTTRRGRNVPSFRSSSLKSSKGVTEYRPDTMNPQKIYTGPAIPNTPILAFTSAADALAWAAENPGSQVFKLHGYARLTIPVTQVLDLKVGWTDQAQAFWSAYVMGGDVSRFNTVEAPKGTVAIFGVVSIGDRVTRA